MSSILEVQAAIIETFEPLTDWEAKYKHIISLGRAMPPLPPEDRIEANRVRGCSSQVWLVPRLEGQHLIFGADSDALITKGLVALLMQVYSGRTPDEILGADPIFIEELGLTQHLSPNRANGLASMVARIKELAREEQRKSS